MAFQAQQAPNYQGAASDMGGHLASMGKANLTYALAKRARDEKRADIKLQKEKDERSFILGNISEGLGIMRENTLLKREDKQKAQIQENWKALEPERISKLHNSLNKEWSIEYAQKQRELNRINSAAAKAHADDPSSMGVVFQPIPMSEYLRTNPLIAKRHTLAEAAQRYLGGIGGEEAGVLKETAAQGDPEADEQIKLEEVNARNQEAATQGILDRKEIAEFNKVKAGVTKEREDAVKSLKRRLKRKSETRKQEHQRRLEQDEKKRISEERRKGREIGKSSVALSKAISKAKRAAERKRTARGIVTSSKVQRKIKQKREDEMDKWSKEFGAVADQNVEERKAAEQAKREAVAKRIVTGSQVKRRAEEMGAKREADAERKAERERSAKRTVAASAAIRKAEKSKEQRLKKERQAKAQETIETSKRKRKAESIMEKIKQEKQKEQEAAATSLREKAAAADDKLEQQFKAQVGEYKGVREKEKKGKENDNREAAANKDVWGKDQIKKYYTKERDGNFLPSAEAMKDDPNAEKKPLSHWIEKEDTDDGGEWKGVTKNPVQFFLKNPDKLKNLSKNNRKTMLKKMSKYFEDTKSKKGYKPWEVNVGKSPSERIIEE